MSFGLHKGKPFSVFGEVLSSHILHGGSMLIFKELVFNFKEKSLCVQKKSRSKFFNLVGNEIAFKTALCILAIQKYCIHILKRYRFRFTCLYFYEGEFLPKSLNSA